MKILHVIVDELPSGAWACHLNSGWGNNDDSNSLYCEARDEVVIITREDYLISRCPDCPLALEHDLACENRKAMLEVM